MTKPTAKKLTAKQEKFAQLTALGVGQAEAYRSAYAVKGMKPDALSVEASRLAANPKIALRVAEIRAPVIAQARYGLQEAMKEAEQAYQVALASNQAGPMVSAVQLRARLNGLMVEDRKNERRPLHELTDAELDRIIEQPTLQ